MLAAGAFTHKYRCQMVYELWQSDLLTRKVPVTQPLKLEAIMTNDVEITAWASEGLPGDELSIQNGLLTTRAARWPLCIDPQMQAVTWIKAREGKQLEGKVRWSVFAVSCRHTVTIYGMPPLNCRLASSKIWWPSLAVSGLMLSLVLFSL